MENPEVGQPVDAYGCRMTESPLPTYDRLGPDPEPLGDRAERLIAAARDDRRRRATLMVAGSVRGRIVVARLGEPVSRHTIESSS